MTGPTYDGTDGRDLDGLISAALTDRAGAISSDDLRPARAPHSTARSGASRAWRRWTIPLAAAAVVVVLAGGTAGVVALTSRGGHQPVAPPASASFSTARSVGSLPTPNTSLPTNRSATSSAATPTACKQLALTTRRESTPSGDGRWIVLTYRNTSTNSCTMTGYVKAQVLDAAGTVVEQIPAWDGVGGQPSWPRSASTVRLAPGASASALIEWSAAADQRGDRCSTNVNVRVTPPGGTVGQLLGHDASLQFPIRMCGEAVTALVRGD